MIKHFATGIMGIALLAIAACSSTGTEGESIEGVWLLTELSGEELLADTSITAEFNEDGQVAGSSGCNSYRTTFMIEGRNIEFGEQIISTMMACSEAVMEQESAYLEMLLEADRFNIMENELVLFNASDTELARFEVVQQELPGTNWEVTAYNNGKGAVVGLIPGTQITANFDQEGKLAGNAGCNNYFADYTTDGEKITIGMPGSTRMFCNEPEGIMEQEQAYLDALNTAATYKIMGLTMEMRTSDGAIVATFQR